MGSLVPGWDTDKPTKPKDMEEQPNGEEEPKGYFAKLEKMKSLHRESGHAGDHHHFDLHDTHPTTVMPPGAVPIELAAHAPGMLERKSVGGVSRRSYVGTDWASELATLGGKGLARTSPEPSLAASTGAWAAKLDSAALNLPPNAEENRKAARGGTFKPEMPLNLH